MGDRAKYLGLVFGIAFSSLLIAQQASIFVSIMSRTASFPQVMQDADIWVMDGQVDNLDIIHPLPDTAPNIVRSVPSIKWAVPLIKKMGVIKPIDGQLNQAVIVGIDDASLVGVPRDLSAGHWEDLRRPEAILIDSVGYNLLWPQDGGKYQLGRVVELNDHRAVVVAVANTMPNFMFAPIIYTQYKNALEYTHGGRKRISFVLAKAKENIEARRAAREIEELTPFRAKSRSDFIFSTILFYIENTGIPINFGLTVMLGLLVAAVIVGLLLNMFISDNIKQFGTLKAMGMDNVDLIKIVMVQAVVVLAIGFSLGGGMAMGFFYFARQIPAMKGFYMPWYVWLIDGLLISTVTSLATLFSLRRVMQVDPAIVFKG